MAAITAMTMNDAATTPVLHTFSVRRVGDGGGSSQSAPLSFAEWEDRAIGIVVGYNRITMQLKYPSKTSRNNRLTLRIATPILENVSNSTVSGIAPAPTIAYTPLCEVMFLLPERSTLQSRKDLLAFAQAMMTRIELVKAVQDLEMPW